MSRVRESLLRAITASPRRCLIACLLLAVAFGAGARHLRVDASRDALILDSDPDLRFAELIDQRYGTLGDLILTYTPREGQLLSPEVLERLTRLRGQLLEVEGVTEITSLLDVPLLRNPPVALSELQNNIKALEDPGADLELARQEFASSPLYRELIVSEDLQTTAMAVSLAPDAEVVRLIEAIRALEASPPSAELTRQRGALKAELKEARALALRRLEQQIGSIRAVLAGHAEQAEIHMAGVPLITNDVAAYVIGDVKVFGVGCFLLLTLALIGSFRRPRWAMLAMLTCSFSGLVMTGLLGWLRWPVSVVSSNFISLQMILALALAVHVVNRYELLADSIPDCAERSLRAAAETVTPCFCATLTTAVGFSSLALCDIIAVSNFGLMMMVGVLISFAITFTLLPALLAISPRRPLGERDSPGAKLLDRAVGGLASVAYGHRAAVLTVALVATVAGVIGAGKLTVESSFVDYFRGESEISQGMRFIDDQLGGTTPLDIVLDFPAAPPPPPPPKNPDDDFGEFGEEPAGSDKTYWLTSTKLQRIRRVHRYLESLPEVGKVMSIVNLVELGKVANDGEDLDDVLLAVFLQELPETARGALITPYLATQHDQARLRIRIRDSLPELNRDELLSRIARDLDVTVDPGEQHRIAGLLLLYSNMLKSLYAAQTQTAAYTLGALLLILASLFLSLRVALVALLPSLLSSIAVLGVMGWFELPLDLMTITIVAIGTGIAVDDAIHYLHQFKVELEAGADYETAMRRSHATVGRAMLITTVAVTVGFSVLLLSNFIPSVLFGALTGLAMVIALIATLCVLPSVVVITRPFGPPRSGTPAPPEGATPTDGPSASEPPAGEPADPDAADDEPAGDTPSDAPADDDGPPPAAEGPGDPAYS